MLIKGVESFRIFVGDEYNFYLSRDGKTLFRRNCNEDIAENGEPSEFKLGNSNDSSIETGKEKGKPEKNVIKLSTSEITLRIIDWVKEKKNKSGNVELIGYKLYIKKENDERDKIRYYWKKG